MANRRRKFDRDFQQGAVRLVFETGKPIWWANAFPDSGFVCFTLRV